MIAVTLCLGMRDAEKKRPTFESCETHIANREDPSFWHLKHFVNLDAVPWPILRGEFDKDRHPVLFGPLFRLSPDFLHSLEATFQEQPGQPL
jgi:hypothetical protein